MNKKIKIFLIVFTIFSALTIVTYASQPETPSLPVLIQNILDAVLGVQSSTNDIEDKLDVLQSSVDSIQGGPAASIMMDTDSGFFSTTSREYVADYQYSETRHVSLTLYIDTYTFTDADFIEVYINVSRPEGSFWVPTIFTYNEENRHSLETNTVNIQFDTNIWRIYAQKTNVGVPPSLSGGWVVTTTWVE